jgi:Mrp family chromosome partitioning ATPase
MQDLLREVSTVYDKIIIDCPPVFGLSDPLILMPQTDGVIFVVHFNVSRRRNVLHALQKLREGQTPMLGGVMNNVDLRRPGGYYYYYHQYAYYYSNYGNKKRKRT